MDSAAAGYEPVPPEKRRKVVFGALERDKQAHETQFRQTRALAISLMLEITAMGLGETVEDIHRRFDARTANIRDRLSLLDAIERRDAHHP